MPPHHPEQTGSVPRSVGSILQAGFELFAEQGFHTTSIAQVAERAGVSKGLIYNYFPSKDDLLVGVVESRLHGVTEAPDDPPAHLPAQERLPRLLERVMGRLLGHADVYRLYTSLRLHPGPTRALGRVEELLRPEIDGTRTELAAIFAERGRATATLDSMLCQMVLDGFLFFLITRPELRKRPESFPLGALQERMVDVFACAPPRPRDAEPRDDRSPPSSA